MNRKVSNLQVGENTLLSFVTAASLGAEYIEFGNWSATSRIGSWYLFKIQLINRFYSPTDVQMTKDMVPVLYHDWTVTETGLDIPVSSITLDQFQKLSASKSRGHGSNGSNQSSPRLENRQLSLTPPPSSTALKESLKKPDLPRRISHNAESEGPVSVKDGQNRLGRSNSLGAMAKLKSITAASEPSDPKAKMKGNGLGTIQAPFATLKDTFEVQ